LQKALNIPTKFERQDKSEQRKSDIIRVTLREIMEKKNSYSNSQISSKIQYELNIIKSHNNTKSLLAHAWMSHFHGEIKLHRIFKKVAFFLNFFCMYSTLYQIVLLHRIFASKMQKLNRTSFAF
jgi:hypothetical protein